MNALRRSFSFLRAWFGLGDTSNDHLTPSHGWLLPSPAVLAKLRKAGAATPAERPLR